MSDLSVSTDSVVSNPSTGFQFSPWLSVGIVQTSLDHVAAWGKSPTMSKIEQDHAVNEIRKYFAAFRGEATPPDIILLPELAVPRGFVHTLTRMAETQKSIVIAGLDYRIAQIQAQKNVANEAVIIIPRNWRGKRIGPKTVVRYLGKAYAAPAEKRKLESLSYGFLKDPTVWIFDSEDAGKFGITICYDFLDLDRVAIYRNQIQHLFVIAYNRDITSFNHAAQAMSRMIFCNVVVCNCGFYGGSIAVSPYRDPPRRTIYNHSGLGLPTAQIIRLPVAELVKHQNNGNAGVIPGNLEFKSLPPGFDL